VGSEDIKWGRDERERERENKCVLNEREKTLAVRIFCGRDFVAIGVAIQIFIHFVIKCEKFK
jgi:hypothetical protein